MDFVQVDGFFAAITLDHLNGVKISHNQFPIESIKQENQPVVAMFLVWLPTAQTQYAVLLANNLRNIVYWGRAGNQKNLPPELDFFQALAGCELAKYCCDKFFSGYDYRQLNARTTYESA